MGNFNLILQRVPPHAVESGLKNGRKGIYEAKTKRAFRASSWDGDAPHWVGKGLTKPGVNQLQVLVGYIIINDQENN